MKNLKKLNFGSLVASNLLDSDMKVLRGGEGSAGTCDSCTSSCRTCCKTIG